MNQLEKNVDITLHNKQGTHRKPRTLYSYENLTFDSYMTPTFGASWFHSLLNGFSSVFEWKGLPEGLTSSIIERFVISSGRCKIIYVNSTYYIVHVTPLKWNSYYDTTSSIIVEPFLGKLNGKKTEIFKNVEIKNNNSGLSLPRIVYPFIDTIDEALFNLDINMKMLSGKLIYTSPETNESEDNEELENAINQWLIDGKPVKVLEMSLLSQKGELPLTPLQFTDSTTSFIDTVRFNISQMLNVLGIPNDNFEDKKERKITSEISIQNILQSAIIEDMLLVRQASAKKMNEIFGLNVTVEVKPEYQNKELDNENETEKNDEI